MEDDELTRARRALHGVDPELDLRRVYAEARARAHGADAHEGWAPDERVEIVLRDTASGVRRTARPRSTPGHGRTALLWGAAAAAATALAVGVVNAQAPPAVPGSPAGATHSASPAGPTPSPDPSPTLGLTPAEVVARAAQAVADAGCGVKTRSTLGGESTVRFDGSGASDSGASDSGASDTGTLSPGASGPWATDAPTPTPLGKRPLEVLGDAAVSTALALSGLEGKDYLLHEELRFEQADGRGLVRVRLTPPDGLVVGGLVTRMDLLVDTATWLPHTEHTWARSDVGQDYVLHSEFRWAACDGYDPLPTSDPGSSR